MPHKSSQLYGHHHFLSHMPNLDTQSHYGIDDVVVIFFQSLDSPFAADTSLGHDELNVLVLKTRGVNFLAIILILILLLGLRCLGGLDRLAMVVAGVVSSLLGVGLRKLCGSSLLGARVDIFYLGFAKNASKELETWTVAIYSSDALHVGVAVGRLIDLGVVDDEEDLFQLI